MKQIKLQSMKIRNFKGFKEFDLKADGEDLRIYGDNATGKTSLYDAFLWVLFGKDSTGVSEFAWKPLDENNNDIHHLKTEIDLKLEIDGHELQLSRITEEVWTRKRATNKETFDKHKTTYRVDGIVVAQKDYKKRIEEIISEETFKQLTNVYYVAETLHHKKRRELLFNLVEPLSDAEVIDSKKELKPLHKVLDGRSVDDKRELIKEDKGNVKKDLDRIPDRIDEVDRSIPDLSKLNKEQLKKDLARIENDINNKERAISAIKNGDNIVKLESELAKKKSELEVLKNQYEAGRSFYVEDLNKEKDKIYRNLNAAINNYLNATEKLDNLARSIDKDEGEVRRHEALLDYKRNEFKLIHAEIFPDFEEHKTVCSVCGQDYPPEKQQEIRENYEKEREAFNQNKAKKLENNKSEGKALADKKKALEDEISEKTEHEKVLKNQVAEAEERKNELEEKYQGIKKQIDEKLNSRKVFEETSEYHKKQDEISEVLSDIEQAEHLSEKEIEKENEALADLKNEKSEVNLNLYQFTLAEKQDARKQELIEEEKRLSARYGELEDHIYLLDEFVRTKVSMLTDRINENFEIVEFKLFEEQLNGGLKEICEPIVKGVPFSGGLNNAARINAGLDIVSTLGRIEGVSAPIFIDNSESITRILETEAQQIQLVVDRNYKELTVETE